MMKSKRIIQILFIFLILIFSLLPIPHVKAGWLAGWDQRVKITIDHNDIDASLVDFPVLIYISNSSGINNEDITFIFDEIGANSLKIAITEDDGTTECYVEVETWDSGNEKAWLWVKGPSIAHDANTEIYLYYDNDHSDNDAYVGVTNSLVAENVWDSDFLMVQHMATTSSPIIDSTSNDINMTETDNPTYLQTGEIDGVIDYDGSDDHFSAINVFDSIFTAGKGTMGLWIKTTTETSGDHMVISIEGAYIISFSSVDNDGKTRAFWSGAGADSCKTTTVINDGYWHYIVTTYDGTNQRVYVEGLQEDVDACNLYDITGLDRASRIAAHWTGTGKIVAIIDDVRISTTNRSSSWIKASYETGRDDLLDWGVEEKAILPPSDPNLLFGAGFNSSSPYVELHWNHSLENVLYFEIQNSTDGLSWDYLGNTTTTNYTDTQVFNGTERYYKVRACNFTDGDWYNSSFSEINFETVYFVASVAGAGIIQVESDAPWIALAIILSIIAFLLATRIKR